MIDVFAVENMGYEGQQPAVVELRIGPESLELAIDALHAASASYTQLARSVGEPQVDTLDWKIIPGDGRRSHELRYDADKIHMLACRLVELEADEADVRPVVVSGIGTQSWHYGAMMLGFGVMARRRQTTWQRWHDRNPALDGYLSQVVHHSPLTESEFQERPDDPIGTTRLVVV